MDEIAKRLTDDFWQAEGGVRRAFDAGAGGVLNVDLPGLNEGWSRAGGHGAGGLESVLGITFNRNPTAGQPVHITFDDNDTGGYSTSEVVDNPDRQLLRQCRYRLVGKLTALSSIPILSDLYPWIGHALGPRPYAGNWQRLGHLWHRQPLSQRRLAGVGHVLFQPNRQYLHRCQHGLCRFGDDGRYRGDAESLA